MGLSGEVVLLIRLPSSFQIIVPIQLPFVFAINEAIDLVFENGELPCLHISNQRNDAKVAVISPRSIQSAVPD